PFILYVGGYGLRKNVKALINAFYLLKKEENYPYQLVLPGKRNRDFDALDQMIEILKLQNDVVFTDHIPVSEMPYFYNAAEVMVYPSIYEGFGLPPLEAMACGTPVIAAKTSSLPEILGDAALWFDPFHTVNLAEQIHRLTASKTLQDLYRQKGLQKAQTYSWKKTAQETASYFREILTVHS
ncbi:MAG: glycosyltransferase family 4 protein, partial [Firmicutes bacterium]|nr:glycosyltransferase family 4 protein [Bacillota bacterium]